MVNLRTVRRVLAVDLGLDDFAIEAHLARFALSGQAAPDVTEISLSEALGIVALAESQGAAPSPLQSA